MNKLGNRGQFGTLKLELAASVVAS